MGKYLLVKGADFSQNKVDGYNVQESFLSLIPLEVGVTWSSGSKRVPTKGSTSDNGYVSTSDFIDIAEYSFSSITLNAKEGYKFSIYVGNGVGDNELTWGWNTTVTFQYSPYTTKIVLMISANPKITLTSNNIFDYLDEVLTNNSL